MGFVLVSVESWHGPWKTFLFMVKTSREKLENSHSYFDGLVLIIYHIYRCVAYIVMSVVPLQSIVFF